MVSDSFLNWINNMKNENYNPKITAQKGGKQVVNIVSSSGIALLIVVIIKLFTDKDFEITDIQLLIDEMGKLIIIIIPIVSSIITMFNNFKQHYFKKEK